MSSFEIVEGAGLILMKSVEGGDDIISKDRLILKGVAFELFKKSSFFRVLELIITSLSLLNWRSPLLCLLNGFFSPMVHIIFPSAWQKMTFLLLVIGALL